MTHHMIPGVPRDWMREVVNVFLIRHPARVIASYAVKRENPTLEDIGFRQQAELFDLVRSWGQEHLSSWTATISARIRPPGWSSCARLIGMPYLAQEC